MKGIQFILLSGVFVISMIFLMRFRKKIFYIFLMSLVGAVSVIFIVWPDTTSAIANRLGVGRGADLVFYISILIFWLIIVQLFGRLRKLEHAVTELMRNEAIASAKKLSGDEGSPNP